MPEEVTEAHIVVEDIEVPTTRIGIIKKVTESKKATNTRPTLRVESTMEATVAGVAEVDSEVTTIAIKTLGPQKLMEEIIPSIEIKILKVVILMRMENGVILKNGSQKELLLPTNHILRTTIITTKVAIIKINTKEATRSIMVKKMGLK